MAKKMLDPTKQRKQIVPVTEEEAIAEPETEVVSEVAPEVPEAPMAEEAGPMVSLNISDIPTLADKAIGDKVSVHIEGNIANITEDMVELNIESVKEMPGMGMAKGPITGKIEKEITIKALKPAKA